jgi:hypothetical protein
MKKAEIIKSKHVDHIENEKKILERIEHPFIVQHLFQYNEKFRCLTLAFYKMIDTSTSFPRSCVAVISSRIIGQ